MRIAVGMIILNGDYVLKQCLESIYEVASQILISEGAVAWWQGKGVTTSTDDTNKILAEFPDPDNKIQVVHGVYKEKTEQCNAYMHLVDPDTDYLWHIDSDEVFKEFEIKSVIGCLEMNQPDSIGFRSKTFYGGFDRVMGGFEENYDYRRIFKYEAGATWATHRRPRLTCELDNPRHFSGIIDMYHYSYVFPTQVKSKIEYYENAVINKGDCIPDYFNKVYKRWVQGDMTVEQEFGGVHEFANRKGTFTKPFEGTHPLAIERDLPELKKRLEEEIRCL